MQLVVVTGAAGCCHWCRWLSLVLLVVVTGAAGCCHWCSWLSLVLLVVVTGAADYSVVAGFPE